MIEGRENLRFLLESPEIFGIAGERFGEDLDGDLAPKSRVPRAIHLAHPALAERADDFECAKFGTDSQHTSTPCAASVVE